MVNYRKPAAHELRYFQIQRSLERTVKLAALAKGPGGKRLDHQRRISAPALEKAALALSRVIDQIRRCRNFEELFHLIESAIGHIWGIGELTIYDTALRIGAKLGLYPERVYLHAGTRIGAKALGIDTARESVAPSELPKEFRRLRPHQIEDCLCIYKHHLQRLSNGSHTLKRSNLVDES
jgi:hypothetical protein